MSNGVNHFEAVVGVSCFNDADKVGLWSKADSVTYFDDLRVSAK